MARYGGIYPIGTLYGQVSLAGRTWDLWTGYNGAMRVYSFLPPSGDIREFSCDVKEFYNYLEKTHAFPAKEQNIIGEFDFPPLLLAQLLTRWVYQFTKSVLRHLLVVRRPSLAPSSPPRLFSAGFVAGGRVPYKSRLR